MKTYQKEIDDYSQSKTDTGKFLKMIKKYTYFEILTTPMLNEYIDKIIVHEATGARKGKDRKQQVDIYFNFVGKIEKIC